MTDVLSQRLTEPDKIIKTRLPYWIETEEEKRKHKRKQAQFDQELKEHRVRYYKDLSQKYKAEREEQKNIWRSNKARLRDNR